MKTADIPMLPEKTQYETNAFVLEDDKRTWDIRTWAFWLGVYGMILRRQNGK